MKRELPCLQCRGTSTLTRFRHHACVPAIAAITLLAALPAAAHEPLWGEIPTTFSFGLWHPEIRYGFASGDRLLRGSARVPNPVGRTMEMRHGMFMLQYGLNQRINLMLKVPWMRRVEEETVGGVRRRSVSSGLGDLSLVVKHKVSQRLGEGLNEKHALLYGLKFPTADNDARSWTGALLAPHEQAGSGRWGLHVGWAWDYERYRDTFYASAELEMDVEGGPRRGRHLELDAAYGYWLVFANRPEDLGIVLAGGPHFEVMGRDRVGGRPVADTGHQLLGFQITAIATKGQMQFRLGVLWPLAQRVGGTQVEMGPEVRLGWEMFF
jgi:hypothetical protein